MSSHNNARNTGAAVHAIAWLESVGSLRWVVRPPSVGGLRGCRWVMGGLGFAVGCTPGGLRVAAGCVLGGLGFVVGHVVQFARLQEQRPAEVLFWRAFGDKHIAHGDSRGTASREAIGGQLVNVALPEGLPVLWFMPQ